MADDAPPTIDKTSVDTETAAKSRIGRARNAYSVSLFTANTIRQFSKNLDLLKYSYCRHCKDIVANVLWVDFATTCEIWGTNLLRLVTAHRSRSWLQSRGRRH